MTPEQLDEALERAKAIIRTELAVVAHRAEGADGGAVGGAPGVQ